jgi:hypothetical protein
VAKYVFREAENWNGYLSIIEATPTKTPDGSGSFNINPFGAMWLIELIYNGERSEPHIQWFPDAKAYVSFEWFIICGMMRLIQNNLSTN